VSGRGPRGDRDDGPATIAQVAALAKVSTATVSRVLSGRSRGRRDTRARVLEAAALLDYRPSDIARSLKRQATRTLGLLVTDILNPYFPQLVRAVEDRAHESGYALLLGNGTDDPEREAAYLESLAARRVDGLLIAASRLTRRHATTLERLRVPTVLVNCESAEGSWPSATSANDVGGRLAAEHLLALGHRRLGLVTVQGEAAAYERRAGIDEALRRSSTDATLHVVTGDTGAAGGEASATRLLAKHPEVTGILCYNDALALGVLRGVREAGRAVPGDVSVVGFDDIELAAFAEPPLTTIRQDIPGLARWAVDRLLQDVREAATARAAPFQTRRWPVTLVARRSAAPPPA
jgi:LacI family transcriptional regulator